MTPIIDPVALLNLRLPKSGLPSQAEILYAKRKLLAEFELAGTVTILFRGREIDRSTALQAVETLEEPGVLLNWVTLHLTPALLRFFQNPQPKEIQKLPARSSIPEGAFQDFLMDLFGQAFLELMDRAVREKNWANVRKILWRMDWVEFKDEYLITTRFTQYVRQLIQDFEALKMATEAEAKSRWEPMDYPPELFHAVNDLPHGLESLRERLAVSMFNASLHLYQSLYIHSQPRILTSRALLLRTSNALREDLLQLHRVIHRTNRADREMAETIKKDGLDGVQIVRILVHVVLLALAIRHCAR